MLLQKTHAMETIYPLISTHLTGPLGIAHLPRLWLKTLLHATGRLPEGYRHGTGGFDGMTLEALGIDEAQFIEYITRERPTYLAFEAWVKTHAKHLDADTIAKHNAKILTWNKSEEASAEQRAFIGIDAPELRHAVMLNDLDDWTCVHAQLTR